MGNDSFQTAALDPSNQFLGPEGALAGGAPDVDPPGVEDQDPGVQTGQSPAQGIEAHFVIGGGQDRRFFVGISQGVQSGVDGELHPPHPPAGFDRAPAIGRRQFG